MNQIVSQGIVLSRTDFGEADRIITVITPDHGKIRLMAKGVRRIKSKLAGGIELFSLNDITFITGRGEISTLISSRLKQNFGNIVRDIDRTMYGYEVLKALNKVTEDMAGVEYFKLLTGALAGLDQEAISLDILKLWFNMQLLKLAGHSPNLLTDNHKEKLALTKNYSFDIDNMTFVPSGRYSSDHIKLLRLGLGLESPVQFAKLSGTGKVTKDCLNLSSVMTRQFIRI